jgi:hypothetical protein
VSDGWGHKMAMGMGRVDPGPREWKPYFLDAGLLGAWMGDGGKGKDTAGVMPGMCREHAGLAFR